MSFTSFCISFALSIWNLFCLSLFVIALMLIASRSYATCHPFNYHVRCVDDNSLYRPVHPHPHRHNHYPHSGHGTNIHFRSSDNTIFVRPSNNNIHGRDSVTTTDYPNIHYRS